ncbi:MAG: hypothetical protein H2172_10600 [Opitutus sp.]|nr:hypothetical protein [Opitutus sp.]MCS6248036.1 hypothetical protein [Opitutus sp.]MCS6274012.1 hypothetical protein [Opitutus sp.]MCS6276801.1 hypothetical protein [Opitutus sp.]MCS6301550.1 hypothetical protein [Opitutus sp.]
MPCALLDVFDVVERFGGDHGFKEKAISATAGGRRKDESARAACFRRDQAAAVKLTAPDAEF